MDTSITMNNIVNSGLEYSDWGWYIDIEHMEPISNYKSITSSPPMKIEYDYHYEYEYDYAINIYDNDEQIDNTNKELNRIKKLLITDKNTLSEFCKKPSTELFVRVGSTTLISTIMAYIIFFIL